MTVNEVFSLLEREVAPVSLSREQCELSGFHDNSGIILNFGGNVTGILFCLDLTPAAAEKAAASGFNLIVTHHPAIFGGIMSLSDAPSSPTRRHFGNFDAPQLRRRASRNRLLVDVRTGRKNTSCRAQQTFVRGIRKGL